MTPQQQFGANLRRLRRAAGLSQMELADRSKLHFTEISRIERYGRDVRLITVVKLARGLDLTPADLLADIG